MRIHLQKTLNVQKIKLFIISLFAWILLRTFYHRSYFKKQGVGHKISHHTIKEKEKQRNIISIAVSMNFFQEKNTS